MFHKKMCSLFILSLFSFSLLNAQEADVSSKEEYFKIKLQSAGVFTDGDFAPFWLTNNNYGIGSDKTNKGYLRVGTFGGKRLFDNQLSVSVGVDALVSRNLDSDFYIQQLFADFNYKNVGLSVGMKERSSPFRNNALSTGGMTLSNNARPIPQAEFGLPHFVTLPYSKGILQVKGGFSYGYFTDNDYREKNSGLELNTKSYVKDVLYHTKNIFLKIEKPQSPWNLVLGLEMGTQWGGDNYEKGVYTSSNPRKISDAFRVLFHRSGDSSSGGGEQINKLGDTFGSYHIVYNYKLADKTLKLYYEHFFEDRSGIEYMNYPDGLYGFEINFQKKQLVSSLLFEFIYTKHQSGPIDFDENGEIVYLSGCDNYYDNGLYISLMNNGYVLGNPLITSPLYNKGAALRVPYNRIAAFHGGLSGYFSDNLSYRAMITYSRLYGKARAPQPRETQFSTMFEANYIHSQLDGWMFSGAIAYDDAKNVVGNNTGFQLKISKVFEIR